MSHQDLIVKDSTLMSKTLTSWRQLCLNFH